MPDAYPTLGKRNNRRGLVASTPGQSGGTDEGISVKVLVELWILSTLVREDGPVWGQEILKSVRESTRIIKNDTVLYPGYTLSNGHLYGLLKEYADSGYILSVNVPISANEENLKHKKQAWRLTELGRTYYQGLKAKHMAALSGALRSLEVLVSRVYDVDAITTPVVMMDRYTDRPGDPDTII